MTDIYVIVAANDKPHKDFGIDPNGEIVFEQYTKTATLDRVSKHAKQLESSYGKCRIAKLVFLEEE